MSTDVAEHDRLSILSQLNNIELDVLRRRPEYKAAFFSATRKGRIAIMGSILERDAAARYQGLTQALEKLRFSSAA